MTDEWTHTTLGDLLMRVRRRVEVHPGVTYPAASVRQFGQGLGTKAPFVGGETNYKHLFVVCKGDVVVRTITAFESPVGVANADHHGTHVSQVFLTYIASDEVLPEYLALVFQTPDFWEHMRDRAQGTVLRRKTISSSNFESIPLTLPALVVQRRIVDLMEHLDTHLANLETERSAASAMLESLIRARFSSGAHSRHLTLAQVADIQLGRMLSKERAAGSEQAPYVRNANIQWSGLDLTDLKQMSFPSDSRERYSLRAGDILVCEGGDPGRCVLMEHDLPGIYYQKAVHRVRPIHANPWFVYGCLRAAYLDGSISDLCTNTTIAHLTGEKFRALKVPDVEIREQAGLAAPLRASMEHVSRVEEEINRSRGVRSVLLQSLLSGHHDIPASYDSLLAVS